METDNYLLKRIQEYKVDFAYFTYSLFNAYKRCKKKEVKKRKINIILNILSFSFSVGTISLLMIFLSNSFGQNIMLYIATTMSFIAIIIDVFLFFDTKEELSLKYLYRAERVNILFKKIKNIEVYLKLGKLNEEEIIESIEQFQKEFETFVLEPLPIEEADYRKAKEQLVAGEKSYENSEIENL